MRKEDCKEGLEVVYLKGTPDEDRGVIVKKSDSIFSEYGGLWVKWKDGDILWIGAEFIEPFTEEPKFTIAEINAILDEIVQESDDDSCDSWYTTERCFTEHGIDKVRKYFKKEKYKKANLKAQALAKLTPEEIKALGIKQ